MTVGRFRDGCEIPHPTMKDSISVDSSKHQRRFFFRAKVTVKITTVMVPAIDRSSACSVGWWLMAGADLF
jgi:hypothetical protein